MCPQIYLKKSGSIPQGFGTNLIFLWVIKAHWQWAILKPHKYPQFSWLLSLDWIRYFETHSPISIEHMCYWCPFLNLHLTSHNFTYVCLIQISNWIRPIIWVCLTDAENRKSKARVKSKTYELQTDYGKNYQPQLGRGGEWKLHRHDEWCQVQISNNKMHARENTKRKTNNKETYDICACNPDKQPKPV